MTELKSWETFAAIVAGTRASVCGSDSLVFSHTPTKHATQKTPASTRTVKVLSSVSSGAQSMWGCFLSGLTRSAPPESNAILTIASYVSTPGDAQPLKYGLPTRITLSHGPPRPEHIATMLAGIWEHSRPLWKPADPQMIVATPGPEQTLPLTTPVSTCFKVCTELAARLARPKHTVSRTIRSPTGGSAILKSAAFGASDVLVVNMDITCAKITIVGKRERCRAAKAHRIIPRNLELMREDQGWRRRTGDPDPITPGMLETALFSAVQALIEVMEASG